MALVKTRFRNAGTIDQLVETTGAVSGKTLSSPEVTSQTKLRLQQEKARLNPFALKRQVDRSLKTIAAKRQARP